MSDSQSQTERTDSTSDDANVPRRSALAASLMGLVGAALFAIPTAVSGLLFLDPLIRKRGAKATSGGAALEGFLKLPLSMDSIPEDGSPVAVTIRTDQDDAWNRFRDVPVGSVWVRRSKVGITVFNSVCPHLGCTVDYRASKNDFQCPCHSAEFQLDGQVQNSVSPRDLDSLESVLVTDGKIQDDGQEIWVKFQNFARGTSEKTPV